MEYFSFKCAVDSGATPGLGALIPPTQAVENPSITSDSPKTELPSVYY